MAYEIGQKVETPLGVGVINALDNTYTWIVFKEYSQELPFKYEHLKPYKTPHEHLFEMGYELVLENEEDYDKTCVTYKKERETLVIDKYKDRYILCQGKMYLAASISLELSRILTQYLEELNEK